MSRVAYFWSRWLQRESSKRARVVWGTVLVAAWGVWFFYVDRWFVAHGHGDLTEGRKSPSGLAAAVLYWPVAWTLWKACYPRDGWTLPWHNASEDEGPDASTPTASELLQKVRTLSEGFADRLTPEDRNAVDELLSREDAKLALELMVISMAERDIRVTEDEGRRLIEQVTPLGIRDRAARDLFFLARRL